MVGHGHQFKRGSPSESIGSWDKCASVSGN